MDDFLQSLQERFGGEIRDGLFAAPAGWTAALVEHGVRFDYKDHEGGIDMDGHQALPLIDPDLVMLSAKRINERCEALQLRREKAEDRKKGRK